MTLNLIPFIQLREFDNNGKLLDGGKIYFYQAGTNVPQDTFQNAQGTINNTNPVILDSAGSAKIFLLPSLYHIQIKDKNDVLIHDIDNVGTAGSGGSTGSGSFAIVDNYFELRNLTTEPDVIYVLGRNTPYDGGQGIFQINQNSMVADDDGIELVRQSTTHYTRQFTNTISPIWYGSVYNSSVDNTSYLLKALDASIIFNTPVLISDNLAIGTNITVKSGASVRIEGTVYGLGTTNIEIRFKEGSKIVNGSDGCFGNYTQPLFERSVCDSLSLSWFSNGFQQVSTSTAFNYRLVVDKVIDISSDITLSDNLEVDFIGGSYLNVTSNINLIINNLVYQGVGQIIKYNNISYIGTVKVGQSYAYLEWFGGVKSTTTSTDNKIPFAAALKHGAIYLISNAGEFYSINTSGTYNAENVVLKGNYIPNNNTANDDVPSSIFLGNGVDIVVGKLSVDGVKIFGSGSIKSTETTINNTIISDTIKTNTGTTANISDVLFFGGVYVSVGNSGKVVYSVDGKVWSNSNLVTTETILTITKNSKYFVIAGTGGKIWTSVDGKDWTNRTSNTTETIYKVKVVNSRLVAVCGAGVVLSSVDNGETWNKTLTSYTGAFRSVTYLNSLYIVVGGNGNVYTSADLLTWTATIITGYTSTTLMDVTTDGTTAVIVGTNGAILTSTNGLTWRGRVGITSKSLSSVEYYKQTKKWIITGVSIILTSDDTIVWSSSIIPSTATSNISSQSYNSGVYLFVMSDGYVLKTFDLNYFETYYTNSGYSLNGVSCSESKFIAGTDDGKVMESVDSYSWNLQTTTSTSKITRIKQLGNLYFVLGANGFYSYSFDATTWTSKSISTTATLTDIVANSDYSLFTIIGTGGKIWTSVDLTLTTPTINERTSNVGSDLNSIVYDSDAVTQKYVVVGNSGAILYSSDATTWNTNNYTSNGIISSGSSNYVLFGDNGLILTSTDMKNWTKRTSNTTSNLTAGVYASGKFVIVGSNGVILTSTDGIAWVSRSSGVSTTFTSIIFVNSNFLATGTAGTLRKSTDGITWTSSYSTGTSIDFNSIKIDGTTYMIVGSTGFVSTSTDLSTWTTRGTGTTTNLKDAVYGNSVWVVVGDNGLILYTNDFTTWLTAFNTNTTNLSKINYSSTGFMVIGSAGTILVSNNGRFWNKLSDIKTTNDLKSIQTINTTTYITGTYFTILTSTNNSNFVVVNERPSGNTKSMVFQSANNQYTITEDDKVYISNDAMVWFKSDLSDISGFNRVSIVNSNYFLYGTNVYKCLSAGNDPWVKMNIVGNYSSVAYGKVNGSDVYLFGMTSGTIDSLSTLSGIGLSATGVSINDSILTSKMINTKAGNINKVKAVSISFVGLTSDSTFSDFDGTLTDTTSRTSFTTTNSIKIDSDIIIVDSDIVQNTDGYDVFQVSDNVNDIGLNNVTINAPKSMLVYSEDTDLKININGGTLYSGNSISLSNGYAKVYLNNVIDEDGESVKNIGAVSINGKVLDTHSFGTSSTITSAKSNWYHNQISNISATNNTLVVNSDILVSNDVQNNNTLRYRFGNDVLRFIKNFGGRVRMSVELPAGYDKTKQADIKLTTALYIPTYSMTLLYYTALQSIGYNNDAYKVGKSCNIGSTKDGAKLISTTNIWSGRSNMLAGDLTNDNGPNAQNFLMAADVYGDYTFKVPVEKYQLSDYQLSDYQTKYIFGTDYSDFFQGDLVGDNTFEAYIVINSVDKNVTLPSGTTIRIDLLPELPLTKDVFDVYFNQPSLLPALAPEVDSLNGMEKVYVDFVDNYTQTLNLHINKSTNSKTYDEQNYLSLTTSGTVYTSAYVPTSYRWTQNNMRFLQQFEPEKLLDPNTTKNINLKLINLKPNPNEAQIQNTTNIPTQFYMLTDGHYKHQTDTSYRIVSRIEVKNYYYND